MSITIKATKKQIRSYLADGIKITLSGSDLQNRRLVKSMIEALIHQRRRAAKVMKDRAFAIRLLDALYHVEQRFGNIERYNYRRHCLEIKNAEPLLLAVLPSPEGKQRRIRATIIGLIDRCKEVCEQSSKEYYQTHSK